ncbi:helix-turn-helix transcriptional regulator [Streptomyces sp. RS10V-4]|uniref:helix-turn-helix domain-containing protein n=1 Tax=Streptomyces rhizoryzae TaxID=2932493 RepID=UPI002002B30B|nr:helix-turn-helix transcriptional regulator [Streptomyces rhizoryzae]MCK7627523.1 helix-turn-helix transcriptional regulator [Streptomyces rhizoryzae]
MVNRKELTPDESPHAAFGERLRRLRDERGWTQEELGERIGCTGAHVSAVETGRRPPTQRFATGADKALGTGTSFEREWREIRNGSLLEGFQEYVRHEGRAAEIRLFEMGVIPGPLQTREYAEALEAVNVERGDLTAEQAAERVNFLIERQAALARPQAPLVIVVLDESCIRRPVGGSAVMERQLARLVEFARQPNTALQLAPFAMGERQPFRRLVHLLTLADRSVVSYVESQTHGHLDRELNSVVPLVRAYHQLQTEALSQADSVAMIEQARKGIP